MPVISPISSPFSETPPPEFPHHHHHQIKPPLNSTMEVCMSLNPHALAPIPSLKPNTSRTINDFLLTKPLFSSSQIGQKRVMVVEAKGKRGMQARQFQRPMPAMPKIEDDGNPRFVIFIRMANVSTLDFEFFELNFDCSFGAMKWDFKQTYPCSNDLARSLMKLYFKSQTCPDCDDLFIVLLWL